MRKYVSISEEELRRLRKQESRLRSVNNNLSELGSNMGSAEILQSY